MNNQRNSGFILNNTENNSNYNILNRYNQNDNNYYSNNTNMKNGSVSSLNKTPNFYRKIDNIYEHNYTHKYINTNTDNKNAKIPTDKNYRNTVSNKNDNIQTRRKILNNNYFMNNNSINYINNDQFSLNKNRKNEMISERSHNKDYKYRKMINTNLGNNNTISLNDLIINKKRGVKDVNNKSIDIQVYDFIKKNDEKDNKIRYQNSSKMSINKSMDSKRLLYKGNNHNGNIIHVNNNTKIINLSNLNNVSYATEKYYCYYENKRVEPDLNQNKNNNKGKPIITNKYNAKTNPNNNTTTKKNNENKNVNKNQSNKKEVSMNQINPILFTKKYPKKESNKYPLRINYTNNNLTKALESESLLENNTENKETEKEYSSRRDSKIITKINAYNSYVDDNKKKNKIEYNNNIDNNNNNNNNNNSNKNNNKNNIINNKNNIINNKNEKSNNIGNNNKNEKNNNISNKISNKVSNDNNTTSNKKIYYTERISTNDVRNNSLNKSDKNTIDNIGNINKKKEIDDTNRINIIFEGNKLDKREVKISNNVPRKYNLTTIHDSLSFKPIKKDNNNNFIIKNNDRLMIVNSGNHNKMNSMGEKEILEQNKDRTYKISSNVVNEQFYKDNYSEKEISSSSDDDFLRMSMQSLNDSKIMEIANRYITDDENLDKNEVIEILNSKKEKL